MTPSYKITANSEDVTDAIRKRFVSMSFTDEAGYKNDKFQLVLEDHRPFIKIPDKGDRLVVWVGYSSALNSEKRGGMYKMGEFILDERSFSKFPSKIELTAHADSTLGSFKESRDQSYHNVTIGNIVREIAARNEFVPKVSDKLNSIYIEHIDQQSQADMAFLLALAKRHNAVMKVVSGNLLFVERKRVNSLSGIKLPVRKVNCASSDLKNLRWLDQSRSRYREVIASYYDTDKAEEIEVSESDEESEGEQTFKIKRLYNTESEARDSARAKLEALNSQGDTLSLKIVGDATLRSEGTLELVDIRPQVPKVWEILKVIHRLDKSGFVTDMECEVKK